MSYEKCAVKGCRERAAYMAAIVIPPPVGSCPDPEGSAIRAYMDNLVVCAPHREFLTPQALISDEGWSRIVRSLVELGAVQPRREDARVIAVSIAEGRGFFALAKGATEDRDA